MRFTGSFSCSLAFSMAAALAMLASPANAAGTRSCTYANILSGACASGGEGGAGTLRFGDKQISGITGLNSGDTVEITDFGDTSYQFQFNLASALISVNQNIGYTIEILDPEKSLGYTFQLAEANVTGGGIPNNSSTSVSSSAFSNGPATDTKNGAPNTVAFNSGLNTATFTQNISVSSGSISSFGLTINQTFPGEPVPGPFPILGAGAAFGFSRRLRKRVRQSA